MPTPNYGFGPEYDALGTEYQELSLLHEAYKVIDDYQNRVPTFMRIMKLENEMCKIRLKFLSDIGGGFEDLDDF